MELRHKKWKRKWSVEKLSCGIVKPSESNNLEWHHIVVIRLNVLAKSFIAQITSIFNENI